MRIPTLEPVGETRTVEALVSVRGEYAGVAPTFEAPEPWWSYVEPVTAHLDRILGVPTAVLRLIDVSDPVTGRGGWVSYHVEAADAPAHGLLDPTPRADWDRILAPHPLRTPWAEPGGPAELLDWAARSLGTPLSGRPVQVKSWNLSCVYKLPTAAGPVWVKATSPFMRSDADVIRHVARYDPTIAPAVLATDPARQWSLLSHAPGDDCFETDADTIRTVVRRWVAVQAAIAEHPLVVNLPTLTPSELVERMPSTDPRLVEAVPRLVEELESSGLPYTLVHGDFHPGNWRSDGARQTIVDWADAYVGHPAHDLFRLSDWVPDDQSEIAEQTWIEAWREHRPDTDPARALEPMTVLAHVINAIVYQRFLDNIEPAERVYHEDDPGNELEAALRALEDRSVDAMNAGGDPS